MQLLEIYNEQLRDLLHEGRSARRLELRATERSSLNVPDATQAYSKPMLLYNNGHYLF